ncbi:VOC family protein [Cohnella zeiphila]|uniref:VOC family protein n=1 Tax=Cohnella zeiphila TaxID=2761120 RepID=A0A7X0VV06_9BACL|nr:VOC family protein [Cohnella zeiphila]MBB6731619.1 VOC family protein [Cohnella zeiphila]
MSNKITPFLWFNDNAEEAIQFYGSIFKNAKTSNVSRYGEGAPFPKGTLMSATFELEGQRFMALNAGPHFKFNEAVSFYVNCETQEEVDDLWEKLTADGGEPGRCGWLKDKFGLSWQIVPAILGELLADKDAGKAGRVTQAMLQMDKIDIRALKQAYEK